MSNAVSIQQVIEDFENLPLEDQDLLLELIHKRRIERQIDPSNLSHCDMSIVLWICPVT
jgi:hypothetical protein